VEAVIKARLNQLSSPARALAGVAAAIGRAFTFDVLARVSRGDEASLVSALDQLWTRRIVREQGADAYDFSHDKIREVAYSELSLARRRLLHRQVAHALEVVHETDLDAVSSRIARHYERAGMPERALHYYTQAADAAARVYANEEAIDYVRCALRLFNARTHEGPIDDHRQETGLQLLERLGDILHLTGQQDQAREAYQGALAHVSEHDWISRARLHRKQGNIWREQHRYNRALTAYEKAEATLDKKTQDQATRDWWQEWVQIRLERMWVYYWLGEWRLIAELEGKTRPAMEQHSTPTQRVNFLLSLTGINLRRNRYEVSEETISNVRAALVISQFSGNIGELAWVRFLLGMCQLWRGDLDEAEAQMLAALKAAEATGDVVHQSRCLTYLTILYRRRGQLDRVRAYISRSLTVAQEADMPEYAGTARANLAYAAWREGDLAAVQAHGQEALELWRQLPPGHASCSFQWTALWPLIAVALTRDQVREAVGYARALIDPSQQRLPDVLTATLERAIQVWQDDRPAAAQELLRNAISLAQEMGDL
jgi:tetratricopeptide (TPR) repeat protein